MIKMAFVSPPKLVFQVPKTQRKKIVETANLIYSRGASSETNGGRIVCCLGDLTMTIGSGAGVSILRTPVAWICVAKMPDHNKGFGVKSADCTPCVLVL